MVSPAAELSREELTRYSRHLVIPDFGVLGQRRLKNARVLVERVRRHVKRHVFHGPGGEAFYVTLSAGIAQFDRGAMSGAEELVALADATLYRAKARGRDRVELASAAPAPEPKDPDGDKKPTTRRRKREPERS